MMPPTPPQYHARAALSEATALCVIHADDDILVVAKPAGLLSVPGRNPAHTDNVARSAARQFPSAAIVHRLDMDTSGIMVLALNRSAHRHLSRQFERREVSKAYIAVVWGQIEQDSGTVDAPLICDWPNRPRQIIDHAAGRSASTGWQVLARDDEGGSTRVALAPKTGRSHQLRVHMASLGHPILGDPLYAHRQAHLAAPRMLLHARALSFAHPADGSAVSFEEPCPF